MENSRIDATGAIVADPRFTVSRAALLPVLDLIARKIIERRNTFPILSNVLIEASPSGQLRVTGTDLDMELRATIAADVETPGAFTVSAETLRDIVKKADKDAQIGFCYSGGYCAVASGRIRQSLPCLPCDDFPIMAMADNFTLSGEFDAVQLRGDLNAVKPAICKEETRYYLRGIFFDLDGDALCIAATDGHRLAQIKRDASNVVFDNFGGAIVPQAAIDAMLAILKDEAAPVTLDMSPSKFRLQSGNVTLYGKLIDGTFPDYRRAMPNPASLTAALSVESKELLQHCATAKGQDGKLKPLSVEIDAGAILAGVGGASGFARPLSAEYDGRDCVFAMNVPYIESFAKLSDRLTLQCGNFDFADVDGAPIRITIADMPEFTGVLMPVRYGDALPKPRAIEYRETLPASGQAADLFGIEAPRARQSSYTQGSSDLIGINPGPRKATARELEAYSRDYAARLGLNVGGWNMEKAKYTYDGPCYAVTFDQGNSDEFNHAVTVLLPGYGQDRAPVTVQYQDDAGEYGAPMACTNAKGEIALPDAPKVRKGKAKAAKPIATPISEPATVEPVSGEYEAPQSAPETQEPDARAYAAPEPEIALCEPEIKPETALETAVDPIAALVARIEALEMALATQHQVRGQEHQVTTPIAAMETDAPLPVQSKPKRSPAHIRAIMAYLRLRRERNAHEHTAKRLDRYMKMANDLGIEAHQAKAKLASRIEESEYQERKKKQYKAERDEAIGAQQRAETALAAVKARADGWPPAVRSLNVQYGQAPRLSALQHIQELRAMSERSMADLADAVAA